MKNLELLPIADEAKKRINEFAMLYKRIALVVVDVV